MSRHRYSLVLVVALLAVAVAGCGGGDDEETSAQKTTTQAQQGRDSGQGQSGGGSQQQEQQSRPGGGGASTAGGPTDVNPDGDSPPSAKQLGITRGGDNSLQNFGEDAEGEEREEVVGAMSAYFAALAEGGIRAACPYLAASFRGEPGQEGDAGDDCSQLARLLSGGPPGALAAEARIGNRSRLLRVGIEEDRAIIVLRTAKGELGYFTMTEEDGEWRATVPTITVLP